MATLFIKGGTVVTDADCRPADLLVADERIAAVGRGLPLPAAARVIDAAGAYVMPGGIDPHVHFQLPVAGRESSDDFVSGSRAALAGGTTTVIDFVTPKRGQSLLEALRQRREEAEKSCCDYGLHMGLSGIAPALTDEMARCVEAEGITSFKAYLAYRDSIGVDASGLERIMKEAAKLKALALLHAEDDDLICARQAELLGCGQTDARYHALSRPAEAEINAVRRALDIARCCGADIYFVHVSTGAAVEWIAAARKRGERVWAETCPHYLLFDDREYDSIDRAAAFIFSPPLRKHKDSRKLWKALRSRSLQAVSSDHCPFNLKSDRDLRGGDFTRLPGGTGGVEYRLPLLYTYGVMERRISLSRWVELTATAPAKIFGLFPRKGTIAPGADADLVIWDPAVETKISAANQYQHCDHTIYEGLRLRGGPAAVLLRGHEVFSRGKLLVAEGFGQFLKRSRTVDA